MNLLQRAKYITLILDEIESMALLSDPEFTEKNKQYIIRECSYDSPYVRFQSRRG